jgi:hypothetical protein
MLYSDNIFLILTEYNINFINLNNLCKIENKFDKLYSIKEFDIYFEND